MAYVLWLKNGKLFFFSGQKAKKIIAQQTKHLQKQSKNQVISGNVACAGRVQGKVRVIMPGDITMLNHAFDAFQQGEILVTTMTQPNMVQLMKKAAAIITDEGGMISHAAIIARELHVPCIVGTGNATKILKDGELVEVDAENGVVRRLEA